MEIDKPSFEKDLWGQCNKLHERLNKKIEYYKSLRKTFKPIHSSFSELNEKIKSMKISMDPTIPLELYTDSKTNETASMEIVSKWYGLPLTMVKIKDFISYSVDYNTQTLFNVEQHLEDLINKMRKEKSEYDDFQKCINSLSDSKKVMEKKMKDYHKIMKIAEQSVLDLKKIEINVMSINDATMIQESKDLSEEKAKQLTTDCIKPFNIYKDSVKKANDIRLESIEKQKHLLYIYQNIEEELGKLNETISNIYYTNLKIQKESIDKMIIEVDKIRNSINTKKDIKQLIINYAGNEKPEEEILFINFPSLIDFDKSDSNDAYRIYKETIEFIKKIVIDEYPNYNKQLEEDKNDMREITNKLFVEYTEKGKEKLLNYIKNRKTHYFFLTILSRLRTNNRFKQSAQLINLLGDILLDILKHAKKEEHYDDAKNCIILSQTFYSEENNEKSYLLEKIRKDEWLSSADFWIYFIDRMINQEIDKFVTTHDEISKSDILNGSKEINDKMKYKISELLFSQLLPYVNNMNEFKLGLKNIVKITEAFIEKYKFVEESHKESIFGLISDKHEEVEKIRKECKHNNEFLKIIMNNDTSKNNNKNKDTDLNNKISNEIKSNNIINNKNNSKQNEHIFRSFTTKDKNNIEETNKNEALNNQKINDKKSNNNEGGGLLDNLIRGSKKMMSSFVGGDKKEEKKEEKKKKKKRKIKKKKKRKIKKIPNKIQNHHKKKRKHKIAMVEKNQ